MFSLNSTTTNMLISKPTATAAYTLPSSKVLHVQRKNPVLVTPAEPTPYELKPLSDIDDHESLRFYVPFIHYYKNAPDMKGRDPVEVIREALAKALVFYYPFAGRLTEGKERKLIVECTGEGVLLVEADANVTLEDFGEQLPPPLPWINDLLADVSESDGIIGGPLLLIQKIMTGGLKLILDKNKLTGTNYKQWKRNLELALAFDKVKYVIDLKAPGPISETSSIADKEIWKTWEADCALATCLALASMDDLHQRQCEKMDIQSIFLHTKELYGERSRVVKYDLARKFFRATMQAGSSVGDHVLKMIDLIGQLADLGFILDNELYIDIILASLPASYIPFISNFNLSDKEVSLPELLNRLRLEESTRKRDTVTTMVVDTASPSSSKVKPKRKIKKKTPLPRPNFKGKGKAKVQPAAANAAAKKVVVECFFCHKKGHMKLQCRHYLATLQKKPEIVSAPGAEKQ